ncbi:unnamed protein product [Macrosiphum euphorbiae]|uniref:YqaJ viral recombinase domain-containing protein n=1 Tax=Macrosiphum euphorbiae TaxID=13131 RepID=A0AAV0XFZ9_9HEMI|nr:unnamed protein product [Macrosiphum euphorbiae]
MGKDWHFGKKCRRKLFVPKKKLKHNLANLNTKKCESATDDYQQNVATSPDNTTAKNIDTNIEAHQLVYSTPGLSRCISEKTCELNGRRLIDIQFFITSIQSIRHKGFDCSFRDLHLVNETRNGFISKFVFKCNNCGINENIHNEDPKTNDLNINMAMVTAMVNVGQGFSQMDEICATLNMPNMCNRTYQNVHNDVYQHMYDLAWNEMAAAGKEEAKLAIEKGEVDLQGRPKIAVITDGAWSKRSYKRNYNASSGVACIVGQRTKKILFIGIRNKYCCICHRSSTLGIESKDHLCFKNWNSPSTAMEADIIVEGFKNSLDMHNLIYNRMIGDGDSNVIKRLRLAKPYGPDIVIKKIECSNHILRNYINKLHELSKKKKSSKGESVPGCMRNLLVSRVERLRAAVIKAVKYRKQQNYISYEDSVKMLKKDIVNSPNHVFGDHENCSDYFCTRKDLGEENYVPDMKRVGLWDDIGSIRSALTYHTESLMFNLNNNAAENYNSILAKFVGGKRVNLYLRGSYELRCNAAVTAYNVGANRLSLFHKQVAQKSPGLFTKRYIKKSMQLSDSRRRCKLFAPAAQRLKTKILVGPDENYGAVEPDLDSYPDLSLSELNDKKILYLNTLKLTKEEIIALEKSTKRQHECEDWHRERKKRLTASVFGKICKLRKTTSRAKTIEALLYGTFQGNLATKYGVEHEEVAKEQLANILGVNIEPSGLYVDSEQFYLAASPDGLIGDDGLVEIKCPSSAKSVFPEEAIENKIIKCCVLKNNNTLHLKKNDNYYYQIQGALHISRRDYCYFCILTPKGILYEKIFRDDNFWVNSMKPQLSSFYINSMILELIDSRYDRGLPIRDGL